jgi:hypothetical protein
LRAPTKESSSWPRRSLEHSGLKPDIVVAVTPPCAASS